MALFDENTTQQLKEILSQMNQKVQILFFKQEIECLDCRSTQLFVEELAALSDHLSVTTYNFLVDQEQAERYQVRNVPAIVLLDETGHDPGIHFYGLPGGYEINAFLGSILALSGLKEELPGPLMARIQKIDKPVHIQVFVTSGCPYCPTAVLMAHRLALENEHIRADMIDSNAFVHWTIKYQVTGVPKTIINEVHSLTGAQPLTALLDVLEQL